MSSDAGSRVVPSTALQPATINQSARRANPFAPYTPHYPVNGPRAAGDAGQERAGHSQQCALRPWAVPLWSPCAIDLGRATSQAERAGHAEATEAGWRLWLEAVLPSEAIVPEQ